MPVRHGPRPTCSTAPERTSPDRRSSASVVVPVPVTPFGSWSFDFTEDEAAELLADCPRGAVLVSHSPPHGAVDRDSRGESLGSVSVRQTIDATEPRLVVCGHIHACAGQRETLGATTVVNAGPEGLLFELDLEG